MLKLYQSIEEVAPARRAVALGTFDGVHLGHRAVIMAACHAAQRLSAIACAATFHPRPAVALNPALYPATLAGVTQLVRLLGDAGAEEVVLLRFNAALAALSPEEFIDHVLIDRLGAVSVCVGADFRFGRDRRGDVELLRDHCSGRAIEVEAVGIVDAARQKISSSRIRALIADGAVDTAAQLLGRPASVEGAVVHGDHRGRSIGFPTANLAPVPGQQLPSEGVYAGWGILPPGEQRYPAAISIGLNPHFGDATDQRVEAHLIGYQGPDLYGLPMRIEFHSRLRAQEAFESLDALIAQIAIDVAETTIRVP